MRHHALRMDSQPLTPEFLAEQDCVLIVTDHSRYDYDFIVEHARLVVDTRNATAGCAAGRAAHRQGVKCTISRDLRRRRSSDVPVRSRDSTCIQEDSA